ncbi:hypothetical protein MLD38_033611 [Melastoma candidum]|uniref:Uncharacterized protein n=1 Tax=Melastoma candidum TaxID=119954 RepID=A0ACB9M747_9MYRT|nr:hypothetical protein MLD38_033611 [Melastoma candidum]
MEHLKDRTDQILFACLLLSCLLYGYFNWTSSTGSSSFSLLPSSPLSSKAPPSSLAGPVRDELEAALEAASDTNRTLIIAIVNGAYVQGDKPMLDLFMDGFWHGEGIRSLVDRLLLVAMDQVSYDRCMFLRLHCYKLPTDGDVVGEKVYMSEGFIEMMWRRTLFLGDVLRRGYSFIFTDTDVIWLRDPFPRLIMSKDVDLQISVDGFNGNETSEGNPINTGFYMIRSSNRTIALFDEWYGRRNVSVGMKEQDVLAVMIREGVLRKLEVRTRFLDTVFFSGFCQDSRDVREVCTVHANCCRTIEAKLVDLTQVIHDWERFKGSTNDTQPPQPFVWMPHSACQNSWN